MPTFRSDIRQILPLAAGILLCAYGVSELQAWIATLPHDHVAVAINDAVKMIFGLTGNRCC